MDGELELGNHVIVHIKNILFKVVDYKLVLTLVFEDIKETDPFLKTVYKSDLFVHSLLNDTIEIVLETEDIIFNTFKSTNASLSIYLKLDIVKIKSQVCSKWFDLVQLGYAHFNLYFSKEIYDIVKEYRTKIKILKRLNSI